MSRESFANDRRRCTQPGDHRRGREAGSPGVRQQAPGIEWSKIAGLGDVLIHAYFGIDLDIVGDVVTNKVPDLARVKTVLGRL